MFLVWRIRIPERTVALHRAVRRLGMSRLGRTPKLGNPQGQGHCALRLVACRTGELKDPHVVLLVDRKTKTDMIFVSSRVAPGTSIWNLRGDVYRDTFSPWRWRSLERELA
jgi:hypothetical protein